MALSLVAEPAREPLTLEDVLAHLHLTDDGDNVYLRGLVTKARKHAERMLSRQLITATWCLSLERFPCEIQLRLPPVQSVESVKYLDTSGALQEMETDEYQVSLSDADRPGRIKPAYGLVWPATRADSYDAVQVEFKAGYGDNPADVPDDIRHAMLLLIGHWHRNREPVNIGNIVNPLPMAFDALMAGHEWGAYA